MKTLTGPGYSFISNDLHSPGSESVVLSVPDRPFAVEFRNRVAVIQNSSKTNEDTTGVKYTEHRRCHGKAPSERKLRHRFPITRLRNSLSSDAIKNLFAWSTPGKVDQDELLNSRDSSPSSLSSYPISSRCESSIPLIRPGRSKSMQRIRAVDRNLETQKLPGHMDENTDPASLRHSSYFSSKAKHVWAVLERRFGASQKIPQSKSTGNLRCTPLSSSELKHTHHDVDHIPLENKKLPSVPLHIKEEKHPFTCNTTNSPQFRPLKMGPTQDTHCSTCASLQRELQQYNKIYDATSHLSWKNQDNAVSPHLITHPKDFRMRPSKTSPSISDSVRYDKNPIFVIYPNIALPEIREVTLVRRDIGHRFGMRIESLGCGIYVTTVLRGSPASIAGLKVGDELLTLNGEPISQMSTQAAMERIRSTPGDLRVTYRPRIPIPRIREVSVKKIDGRVGIRLKSLKEGLFVDVVLPLSAASNAGIREGDELIRVNNQSIKGWSQDAASQLLRDLPNGEDMVLCVREIRPLDNCRENRVTRLDTNPKFCVCFKEKITPKRTKSLGTIADREESSDEAEVSTHAPTSSVACRTLRNEYPPHHQICTNEKYSGAGGSCFVSEESEDKPCSGHRFSHQVVKHGMVCPEFTGTTTARMVNSLSDWALRYKTATEST